MDRSVVTTRYWHRTGDGRVQCDVCPRACRRLPVRLATPGRD